MIRAMVVDDEELARERLRSMLVDVGDVEIVGEAEDGVSALRAVEETRPDLLFLDIQMPGLTGMEVASRLTPPRPRIVFCTAFDQYAIDAFELHAVDYLLKPLSRARLQRSLDGVRRSMHEGEGLRREVEEASATQARLFPRDLPHIPTLEYAGLCRSARGIGGDYYDFLAAGRGRLGLALGDVSGKGLYASLLMAGLQGRIQSLASRWGDDLASMMAEVNTLMYATTEDNRFATLFYAIYDESRRELTYVNAGHLPPLVFRPRVPPQEGSRIERLEPTGTVVGLLAGAAYLQATVPLSSGDILLAYTDGVTEARNPAGEEFGERRLAAFVATHGDLPARRLCESVLEEADRFSGGSFESDDLTLLVAKGL